jgi:hypothetical protein
MAEDTWALNEGVIDEQAFLDQSYSILAEREAMFRNALEKTPRGVVACVFDTSDGVAASCSSANSTETAGMRRRSRISTVAWMTSSAWRLRISIPTRAFALSDHGFCSFAGE